MPISFSCSQCGKDYVVSDGLGGKRAVCKACGNRMTIPGGSAAEVTAAPTAQPTRPRPTATAPSGRPAPKPTPAYEPPAEDVYGFDEAPSALPPIMPRTGGSAAAEETASPVPKKKKKKGFFSSSKKPSGSSFQLTGTGGGWRLLVVGIAIITGIGGWFATRSDVERTMKQEVALVEEFVDILSSVNSLASAQAASPRLNAQVQKMIDFMEANRHKKADKRIISDVKRQLEARLAAAQQRMTTEMARISRIPGALAALNFESSLQRLAAVTPPQD